MKLEEFKRRVIDLGFFIIENNGYSRFNSIIVESEETHQRFAEVSMEESFNLQIYSDKLLQEYAHTYERDNVKEMLLLCIELASTPVKDR